MKRIGLLLLAVVLVAGLAGCSKDKDHDADPVGTWVLLADLGCNGIPVDNWVMHIYPNGTFIDSDQDSGTWTIDGDNITFNYLNGFFVLNGKVDDDQMEGTIFSGAVLGCWTATRTSNTP